MNDIICINNECDSPIETDEMNIMETGRNLLEDVRTKLTPANSLSVPIAELSTLGTGVSSLIPALNTVTQTTTIEMHGLYRLANQSVGDVLKVAKNGNFWGAFKTLDGGSKFVQLTEAGTVPVTSSTVAAVNPATMMMAVALFSIEQKLGSIEETTKQIISFLEIEKQSEIEADLETLNGIIAKYKLSWDNAQWVANNHQSVLDIQRTARKNMLFYQKQVEEALQSKKLIVAQKNVNSILADMQSKFKYYRLTLFTYSLASLVEVILSGNFKEEYIFGIKEEIRKLSENYRVSFMNCSEYLEKISTSSLETNVLKGVGIASKAVGKFIGSIPVVKEGQVDEFLQDSGASLLKNTQSKERNTISSFAELGNPKTVAFIDSLNTMIQIYNHTSEIYFDDKQIYLLAG